MTREQLTKKEQIWLRAYCAALSNPNISGLSPAYIAQYANQAVEQFEKKFGSIVQNGEQP